MRLLLEARCDDDNHHLVAQLFVESVTRLIVLQITDGGGELFNLVHLVCCQCVGRIVEDSQLKPCGCRDVVIVE